MPLQHLLEGLDPTGQPCITTAMLLQMIRNAQPYPDDGFIHWAAAAPDVVANPELARFLWGKTVAGLRTSEISFHDGTSWEALPFGVLVNSVTLDKLSGTGAVAFDIIQRNAANTAFVFTQIANAIVNGSLPPGKLQGIADAANYVLTSFSGITAWTTIANLLAAITDNTLPINKLIRGGANTFLRVNAAGTGLEWTTAQIADLQAPGYVAGQSPRRNSGNTGWEAFTAIASTGLTAISTSGLIAVPVLPAVTTTPFAHGLGVVPKLIHVKFVCVTDEDGYVAGEELDANGITLRDSDDDFHYQVVADGTNVTIVMPAAVGYELFSIHKTTGAIVTLVAANWQFRIHAFK